MIQSCFEMYQCIIITQVIARNNKRQTTTKFKRSTTTRSKNLTSVVKDNSGYQNNHKATNSWTHGLFGNLILTLQKKSKYRTVLKTVQRSQHEL